MNDRRLSVPNERLPRGARERQILALIAEGLSNQAIAERLAVPGDAVEADVERIFEKLELRDERAEDRRVAAVLTYLRATAR